MIVDRKVVLTGSVNWTASAPRTSEDINLVAAEAIAAAYTVCWQNRHAVSVPFHPARRLVPQARDSPLGIAAQMKPGQDDRLNAERRSQPPRRIPSWAATPPEISGRSTTRCSKRCAVSGGGHSIVSAIASCSFGWRSLTVSADQNRPRLPTYNARGRARTASIIPRWPDSEG